MNSIMDGRRCGSSSRWRIIPVVSSNLVNAGEQLFAKPFVILNVNHLRVAVIGAMTDSLNTLTTPKSMGDWHTLPVVAAARKVCG